MPEVVRSIEIQARPSKVWGWFSSQDALRSWLGSNLEIDLRVGGAYRMLGADEETWIRGTVLELVQEGRLVLSWLEEDAGWVHPGRLVIEIEAIASGSRVTLIHDGFAGIGKTDWTSTYKAYELGAERHRVLEKLAAVVASGE
jgi:uncharacterized protein YndB with AHSA1/START domain